MIPFLRNDPPWLKDSLWARARSIPSLDLKFEDALLRDAVSGQRLVTFTRATTGTYVGSDGLIKTAAIDEPRITHDPKTGRRLGLLVEEARTNLLLRSEEFGDANWGKTRVSVTANAAIAPDGTLTADKLIPDTSTNTHFIGGSYASSINTTYTLSCFIKAAEYTAARVVVGGTGYSDFGSFHNVNLLTGAVIAGGSGPLPSITALPNGWWRITSMATTDGTTASRSMLVLPCDPVTGSTTITGDGTSGLYIWGAQLEVGSTASSYIPTTSSAVTRAADIATVSNTGSSLYPETGSTIINTPFGTAAGGSSLKLLGPTIDRTVVFSTALPAAQINEIAEVRDDFWRWRVLGNSFALPSFTTDGSVTVDWGDGTVETLTTAVHAFANGSGYHEIGFRLNSGTYFRPYLNANSTYAPRVIAVGPAPVSMKFGGSYAFYGCSALKAFDSTVDVTGETSLSNAWRGCSSLTSFPALPDTSQVTSFSSAWRDCSSLTSFPALPDTSQVTTFAYAWYNCSSLTSFPALPDTSRVTNFVQAWYGCSSLTSFPPLPDTSQVTSFGSAWYNCSSLTSFPALPDTSQVTTFAYAWRGCSSLTSFPALPDTSRVTNFFAAWYNCSSLTSFPANQFDTTGTLAADAFNSAFASCALTAASIENILTSLGTNGQSGITLSLQGGTNAGASTWTPAAVTAYDTLISRGWTITRNA